jgi:hypothetical protein
VTREVGNDPEIVEKKECVFRQDRHGSRSLGGRGTLKAIAGRERRLDFCWAKAPLCRFNFGNEMRIINLKVQ